MIDPAVLEKVRRFLEAREARDEAKQAATDAENEYRAQETELWDMLNESAMMPPFRFNLGEPHGTVVLSNKETKYARVLNRDDFLDYLESRQMTDEIVTEPGFVKKRLNEIVREAIDDEAPLPPGLDYVPNRYVSITKQK